MIGNLNASEKEFARGVLASGWNPKTLYGLTQPDVAVDRLETAEEAAIGLFCGEYAEALLSTRRLFEAGKLAAEARLAGADSFAAMPCDNRQ